MNPLALRYVLSGLIVLGGVVTLVLLRKRWPGGLAVLACYVLPLAPVLGFMQSGQQLVADRYSYVACMALAVLAGAAWYWVLDVRRWVGPRLPWWFLCRLWSWECSPGSRLPSGGHQFALDARRESRPYEPTGAPQPGSGVCQT